ncbi:MAG: MFS transporter [Deltaproteobacteria bacterium]|nr:MFS transporter [Deltaproteobacteria bacterium]MBI2534838.1 MFS transporter [Deltaproteobacteria bacterium]
MVSTNSAARPQNSPRPEKRVSFAALQHRDFRWFFFATMLAMMADNIEHVISYWLLFQKFESTVLAGFAVISHWLPFLLLSVYFGALADRHDCRKLIQIAQVMYMAVSAAWAILFFTDTIEVWHACVLLVIHGVAGVFWTPAEILLIHDIVGSDDLPSAVRLNATSRQLGILFGPAVGGGLMLWLGAPSGLWVNALIYLPFTIWLAVVPYTGHTREGASARRALRWWDAVGVLQEVWQNRPIITMILLGGAASFFVGNAFHANMPEFAHDLGTEKADIAYSALLAANAAGSVAGGFLLDGKEWLPPTVKSAILCAILWCVIMTGFAFSTSYVLSLALLFFGGALNLAFYSIAQTIVQLLAPVELRGRLIGLFSMSAFGLRAFSGVTVGVVGGLIGIHWSLAVSSMVLLAVSVALFAFAAQRRMD